MKSMIIFESCQNADQFITYSVEMGTAEKELKLRKYYYQPSWEEEYFVVPYGDGCTCLVCGHVFGNNKKYNIERHFTRFHAEHNIDFPKNSAARQTEITDLKSKLQTALEQPPVSTEVIKSGASSTTMLSYKISYILAKAMKPFEDGAIMKEIMIAAVNELIHDGEFKDSLIAKVNVVPVSNKTVARRVKSIAANITEQLSTDLQRCEWFSLQLGESTHVVDTAQLGVFIRMVFKDCSVTEELLSMIPLKGKTTGEDIFAALKDDLTKNGVPLQKLVAITMDGAAPPIIGRHAGLVGLCKQDPDFPAFASFDCIIHQQSLCGKSLNATHVLEPVTKIVNSIQARPLQHGLFQSLLETADTDRNDLLLHTEVKWLSRGGVLNRFCEALPQIKEFLQSRNEKYVLLEDPSWLLDLAFFADLTKLINELNLQIQGKNISIWSLISAVNNFREQISLWIDYFRAKKVSGKFDKTQKMVLQLGAMDDVCGERFAHHLEKLKEAFDQRFQDFKAVEVISKYVHVPMLGGDTAEIALSIADLCPDIEDFAVREEMIKFRNDDKNRWKLNCNKDESVEGFWKMVDGAEYKNLVSVFKRLLSCFGSSYLCKSIFSSMKHVKSKLRSRLTDDNVEGILRISVSSYEPDFQKLGEETRSQASH